MRAQIVSITILILLATVVSRGQEGSQNKAQDSSLLRSPEVVRIEILPRSLESHESPEILTKPYQEGDKIYFRLQMTNTSPLPIELFVTADFYFQNRPTLYRDGEIVSYRKGLSETLAAKDKEFPVSHNGSVRLAASESRALSSINLHDWYESLEPGHYQLSIKHRFEPGQQWIESSNSVIFEVVPKNKGAAKYSETGDLP